MDVNPIIKAFCVVFPMTMVCNMFYAWTFMYNLIPMLIQIIFSCFIQRKNILKSAITIFLTQGIVLAMAQLLYEMMHYIYDHIYDNSNRLGFWDMAVNDTIIFDLSLTLLLFAILTVINYFVYRDQITNKNYKKFIFLMSGYLINLTVVLHMMIKYRLFIFPHLK